MADGNGVNVNFTGDNSALHNAAGQAEADLNNVGNTSDDAAGQLNNAGGEAGGLGAKLGHLGGAVSGATDALDTIGGSLTAVNDLMNAGDNRAAAMRRALIAVEQAQEDYNQALRDGAQAALDTGQAELDLEQANLDASIALKEYNKAVKEHGKNSDEAKQAGLDLKQAQQDVKQATEDGEQATRDAAAALINAKTAQEDLNDANKEAHPPELQKWADNLALLTPLLSAVVGIVGLVTAAQWLWNTSLLASPVTWIIIGIVALVAVIVLIATKTTWFQTIWETVWGGITAAASWAWDKLKAGASAVWDYLKNVWNSFKALPEQLKDMFSKVTGYITQPFRTAFNYVADAWNSTVGGLSFTVPGWVPGIGGNSFSAPRLSKYHQGGIVSGALGAESLAVLQAGERVTQAGGGGERVVTLNSSGEALDDWVLDSIRRAVGLRGGDPVRVIGNTAG